MAVRVPIGASGADDDLIITLYSADALTWAVGDQCALNTSADFTVIKPVDDTALFGDVVAIQGPALATSALSTLLSVRVYGFSHVVKHNSNAAVATGVTAQHNGTGNNIETSGVGTGNNVVVGDVALADGTYDIYMLT